MNSNKLIKGILFVRFMGKMQSLPIFDDETLETSIAHAEEVGDEYLYLEAK